jgi:tetratricopeptide (TPR) repeat protein
MASRAAEKNELKPRLLELSEEIVEISDRLDELEFDENSSERYELFSTLRQMGDQLVEWREKTDGDDLAYLNFMLGSVCALLGYYRKAEEAYDMALSHWPDHVGILNEAFDVLIELGKHQKAKEFIERSIRYGGETPDVLYNYASLTAHMGDISEAKIILINTLAKFPGDQGCRALLEELDAPSGPGKAGTPESH